MEGLGIRVSGKGSDFKRFGGLKSSVRVLDDAICIGRDGCKERGICRDDRTPGGFVAGTGEVTEKTSSHHDGPHPGSDM